MFIILTVIERYEKDRKDWRETGRLQMRFNINHIVRYCYDGEKTWLYTTDHNTSEVFKVTETDKQIDAMVRIIDPTAAKVLFAKKE